MILKVWLRNWKAYDSLDLSFTPGTNFVIAENGIGKSSIVQGIYFALFGSPSIFGTDRQVCNAVRGGSDAIATVGCELSLGSKTVRLERNIGKSSNFRHITKIEIDGKLSSEEDWLNLVQVETGVDAAQLALLSFVHEGAATSLEDAGITTVGMLDEVFGVGRLRRSAHECELTAKHLNRENDNLRKSLRDSPSKRDAKQLVDLQERILIMTNRLQELKSREIALRRREAVSQDWARYHSAVDNFQRAIDSHQKSLSSFAEKIKSFTALADSADGLVRRHDLNLIFSVLSENYERLVSERGRLEGEREASLRNVEILSGGEPRCPTCRQPLSQEAASHAIVEHQQVTDKSSAEMALADRNLARLRSLIAEARELVGSPEPSPPIQPSEPLIDPLEAAEVDASSLRFEISQLEQTITESKAELAATQRLDEERKHNAFLSHRLLQGYRAVERAQLAATTMTKLADAICAERISPIAEELQKRWLTLSSDSRLYMDSAGALSLEEGKYLIPYYNLSGGQRTLAQLAVRLLALQMATKCPFFILDEPLEHLDPRNRRSLATLLVHATHGSSRLRQVLITTYEESVTRRLSSVPTTFTSSPEASREYPAHVVRISASRPT